MLGQLYLLKAVTSEVPGAVKVVNLPGPSTVQFKLSGTSGTVSAELRLYLSNDPLALTAPNSAAKDVQSFALAGTATGVDVAAAVASVNIPGPWMFAWAEVIDLNGSGASVDCIITGREVVGTLYIAKAVTADAQLTPVVVGARNGLTVQVKLSATSGAASADLVLGVSNDPVAQSSPDAAAWNETEFHLSGVGSGVGVAADNDYDFFVGSWTFARLEVQHLTGTGAQIDAFVTGD